MFGLDLGQKLESTKKKIGVTTQKIGEHVRVANLGHWSKLTNRVQQIVKGEYRGFKIIGRG